MRRAQEQVARYFGAYDAATLPAGAELFIYGAGEGGRLVARELARLPVRILGFIDGNPGGPVAGYPVFPPGHLATADRPGMHLVLASQFWADIAESLPVFRFAKVHNAHPLIVHLQGRKAGWRREHTPIDIRQDCSAPEPPAGDPLLDGLRQARNGDLYHAADAFYRWLEDDGTTRRLRPEPLPSLENLAPDDPGPPWVVKVTDAPASPDPTARSAGKAEELASLVAAAPANANLLAYAAALALARHDAKAGRFDLAERRLEAVRASHSCPSGMHHWLRNTLHAIGLARAGEPVPPQLARLVGDDNGYFSRRMCLLPFQRFDIQADGAVLVCCGHWLPTAIGNVLTQEADSVLNSPVVQDIRRSMLDGSFKYCDAVKCGAIASGTLEKRDEVVDPEVLAAMATGRVTVDRAHSMVFALDQSCNLSCPSCRTTVQVEGREERERKLRAVDEVILPLLSKASRLQLDTAGELFVSKVARRLLSRLNPNDFPHLEVNIITNGTLFDERQWASFPDVQPMIGYVRVSTDAATQKNFEKLRRGARWGVFRANMDFIAKLRRDGKIREFDTSFTYQSDNFREIPDFISWCFSLGCDYVNFEKLENIVFSTRDYLERAVHLPSHPDHDAFRAVLRHPAVHDPRVRFDIDLANF
jgi:hypothetical protein